MKNVTIALDEATLREARRIAAERSTSLNALIRDFLERLTQRESHAPARRAGASRSCVAIRRPRSESAAGPATSSMSVDCFLDTNVLVYAVSSAEADAAEAARRRSTSCGSPTSACRPRCSRSST